MPALNAERHFENGHCNMPDQRRVVVAGLVGGKVERTLGKENDRPERPEKPERRPNSKELIEKQRNWTSHFSKTRPSRYNSDPNRSLVQTSLNSQSATHNVTQQQQSSVDGLCQSSSVTGTTNDAASPARSASFCSARSPPPPLPPIRNSSAAGRRERPASIATLSPSDLPESPEYATIEKFDDISPTIPEYAVVQKTKKPQEGPKESQDGGFDKIQDSAMPEYAVVQKNSSKSVSKPVDGQKEDVKTAQNSKNTLATELVPACKPVVPRSLENSKDTSKVSIAQNSKVPTTVETTPTCKNAFPRSTDVLKETSKVSISAEETTSLKTTVSRPMESLKETVDCSKEISRSPITTETVTDTKIAITKEYNDLPEQTKSSLVLHYELSSPIRSSTSVDSAQLTRRESDLLEAPEYLNCPPSPIHSPAKTSEWRNEWLAKNDEILKRTVDMRDLKSSSKEASEAEMIHNEVMTRPDPRPDWARPNANAKRKETTSDDKRTELIRSPESELGLPSSAGTDSASSSMSSPSSPSKDSKEEKAEKEMSEKHQTGEFLVVFKVVFFVL